MTKSSDSTQEELLKDFTRVRQQFTSLETMAEALRVYEGFENLNRATLSRWLANPSKRDRVALEILNARRPTLKLWEREVNFHRHQRNTLQQDPDLLS